MYHKTKITHAVKAFLVCSFRNKQSTENRAHERNENTHSSPPTPCCLGLFRPGENMKPLNLSGIGQLIYSASERYQVNAYRDRILNFGGGVGSSKLFQLACAQMPAEIRYFFFQLIQLFLGIFRCFMVNVLIEWLSWLAEMDLEKTQGSDRLRKSC